MLDLAGEDVDASADGEWADEGVRQKDGEEAKSTHASSHLDHTWNNIQYFNYYDGLWGGTLMEVFKGSAREQSVGEKEKKLTKPLSTQ